MQEDTFLLSVLAKFPNVEKTSVSMKELMKNIPDTLAESRMLFALGKDLIGN